jgi:hypothetical protein
MQAGKLGFLRAVAGHRMVGHTVGKKSIHTLCFFLAIPFNDLLENLF